jgi:hypothetical protein
VAHGAGAVGVGVAEAQERTRCHGRSLLPQMDEFHPDVMTESCSMLLTTRLGLAACRQWLEQLGKE